jgi:hypothetical protein
VSHTCPGLCGRTITGGLVACPGCTRELPMELRTLITTTWWARDWPAHSRALADALHHYAAQHHRGRPWRTGPA